MSGYLSLVLLRKQLHDIAAQGGTVPCWDDVDYWCDNCPVLRGCSAYSYDSGEEGVQCRQ